VLTYVISYTLFGIQLVFCGTPAFCGRDILSKPTFNVQNRNSRPSKPIFTTSPLSLSCSLSLSHFHSVSLFLLLSLTLCLSFSHSLSLSARVSHLTCEATWPNSPAGRRTKFAPVKSLNSSEFSPEFWDLGIFTSNVKVNPVISWNGHNSIHKIFPSNSQDFSTPQISFEFSEFYYTTNSFLIKPPCTNDRKTRPFREILS